jgi:single-strand DNA-binding protein
MNKVILMGRLTAVPELKSTTNGNFVTSFTVAVDRPYTPQGGEKITDFLRCVAWRQTAEFICKYFTKGQMIALDGSVQTRKYTDRDGADRTATEILADRVYFCGSKQEAKKSSGVDSLDAAAGEYEYSDTDDLPF